MVTRWRYQIAAVLVLGTAACDCAYACAIEDKNVQDSEVLQAALATVASSLGDSGYVVVVNEPQSVDIELKWIEAQIISSGLMPIDDLGQTLTDYKMRNTREHLPTTLTGLRARFVERKAIQTLFAGDAIGGWRRFWAEFPGATALLDLSLPGYSPDGAWSIVSYTVSRGSLAGEVWVALLHRKEGSWAVEWSDILVQS